MASTDALRAPFAGAIARLRSAALIRERANRVFLAAERGELAHFVLDLRRLDDTARYVLDTIRTRYPDLDIPGHSRWRHFDAGDVERWPMLATRLAMLSPLEIARRRIELASVSVLLDAGAGPDWRYRETGTGLEFARSEGLAVASLHLFAAGMFSAHSDDPLRVDAAALERIEPAQLAAGFQVGADNPLVGLDGRAALLRALGRAVSARPDVFGTPGRIGNLVDALVRGAQGREVSIGAMLASLLDAWSGIWPGGYRRDGQALGDVWPHPAARVGDGDPTDGLVPFHKLAQWLCYSLIEPMQDAGFTIDGIDALTGLPEYRNGGLFIDLGVLVPRRGETLTVTHAVGSELVVEWRALTLVLLDRLAERIRIMLGRESFPLPLLLEGGSWAAGRRIAAERRAGGTPPLSVASDGTIF